MQPLAGVGLQLDQAVEVVCTMQGDQKVILRWQMGPRLSGPDTPQNVELSTGAMNLVEFYATDRELQ